MIKKMRSSTIEKVKKKEKEIKQFLILQQQIEYLFILVIMQD